jgi:hypothetical protein
MGIARATVIAYAGVLSGSRFFEYNQSLTPSLRDYQLYAAFHVTFGGEIYPLARTRIPVARDLGIGAIVSRARARLASNGPKIVRFGIVSTSAGVRLRLRKRAASSDSRRLRALGLSFDDGAFPSVANDPRCAAASFSSTADPSPPTSPFMAASPADRPSSTIRSAFASGTRSRRIAFKGGVAIPIIHSRCAHPRHDRFFYAFHSSAATHTPWWCARSQPLRNAGDRRMVLKRAAFVFVWFSLGAQARSTRTSSAKAGVP